MPDFDFRTTRQVPDYSQILQILGQRMNLKNPWATAIDSGMSGIQQGMQIGQQMDQRKQQKAQEQARIDLANMLQSANAPVQGPVTPPVEGPITPEGISPAGGSQLPQRQPLDWQRLSGGMIKAGIDPTSLIAEMMKPTKLPMEWAPVSGMIPKGGKGVLEIDKTTGQVKTAPVPEGVESTGYGSTMAPIRKMQYTIQDLPSNQGPNTAGGAAYQVKVGARQGKSMIAKPGAWQAMGLSAGDVARSVLRAAPQEQIMREANFSENMIMKANKIRNYITADPNWLDTPKEREAVYHLLDELDKAATPWIEQQLDNMEEVGFSISPQMRKREMGLTIPDIPFIDNSASSGKGEWGIKKVN